jgi:hypothetical protein
VYATARRAFREGYAEHAPLPPIAPAVAAAVWLRLARRNPPEGRNGARRHALERARSALRETRT